MADGPEIWRIRYAVTENTLTRGVISDEDLRASLEDTGRGWVSVVDGTITGFAIGLVPDANVWGLFIDPPWQGRGHGGLLHDVMVDWLFEQGLQQLWLATSTTSRARAFYEARGWREVGPDGERQVRYELTRAQWHGRVRGD